MRSSPNGKTRILIVEDHAVLARAIARQLTRFGYEPVAQTAQGGHALDLAGQLRPDLVVMDIRLAGEMDGISAAQAIRERFAIPVVFLTALKDAETLERAKAAEPFGYITKPFHDRDLRAAIEMALYKHQVEEDRKAHLRFLESLERIDRAIKDAADAEQILWNVTKVAFSLFDCDRSWLFYPCDPDAPSFRVPTEICRPEYPGAKILNVDVPALPDLVEDLRAALASDAPVIRIAGTEKPVNKVTAEQFGVQSQMFVALYPKVGKPWVFGMHQCSYPRNWTQEESQLFREIARRLSDGLSSALYLQGLRESEVHYRTLAESSHDLVFLIDRQDRVEYLNGRAAAFLGGDAGDLVGRKRGEIFPPEVAAIQAVALRRVLETAEPLVADDRIDGPSGTVWLSTSLTPITDESGDVQAVLGVARDITERKTAEELLRKSERRFRAIIEHSYDAVTLLAADGTVLYDSPSVTRVLGYAASERLGRRVFEFAHPDDRNAMARGFDQFARQPGSTMEYQGRFLHKDGQPRWISGVRSNLLHEPAVRAIVVNYQDITERKRTEEALRRSERTRAEAERLAATGRMAARIAHEISNPLAGIKNAYRLVRDAVPQDHPDRDMVERIDREIARISNVVQQMYTLYSSKAPRITETVVAGAVRDVLSMLEPLRRESGVEFDTIGVHPGLTVRTLEGGLHQIVYNLLANAIEASPSGGVIAITTELDEDDPSMVRFSVRDRGKGIPPEIQPRIFEPFFTSGADEDGKGGLGLGLSVVKNIVEAAGGTIEFDSIHGQGTTFRVVLPTPMKGKEA